MLCVVVFFFLSIRRPPRSTLDRSSAASDVYKRQLQIDGGDFHPSLLLGYADRVFEGEGGGGKGGGKGQQSDEFFGIEQDKTPE